MKNNTHGYALVIMLIVMLIIAVLFAMSITSLGSVKQENGDSDSEIRSYEDIAGEAVANAASGSDMDPYAYLDE